MKLKTLLLAGMIALSSAISIVGSVNDTYAAFNPDDAKTGCPKSSLYKTKPGKFTGKKPTNIAECNVIPDADGEDVMSRATVIINVIVSIVGIISVAVIVIGGITFATSQGDTAKTTKAKNTILYGIVGLIIALLAFAIVNFVLKSVF